MIRIAIYEDHADLRSALALLIGDSPDFEVVGTFEHCLEIVAQCAALQPHIVLMDIDMPGMSGIKGASLLKKAQPSVEVVMLTVFDDDDRVFEAVCAGASGYLLKKTPPARLLEALAEVKDGGAPMSPSIARKILHMFPAGKRAANDEALSTLTPREMDVISRLSKGYSYKMVAAELQVSIETVRTHVKRTYEKLHVHSLSEATSKLFPH